MKPLWQELHEGFLDDIKVTMEDIEIFDKWIIQAEHGIHPHLKQEFISTRIILEKKLSEQRKEYKERYGRFPTMKQIREHK